MITSIKNEKIQWLKELKNKVKFRKEKALFLVEGEKMIQEIPIEQIHSLYFAESYKGKILAQLFPEEDIPFTIEQLSDRVFSQLSDVESPQGIFALVRMQHAVWQDLLIEEGRRLIVFLEKIQDPGNLGTIFRTAEAAGVSAIFLSEDCVDPYNPKVVRSTMGSLLRVPFCRIEDFSAVLCACKNEGYDIYAADLQAKIDFRQERYKERTAFIFGNESKGLSEESKELATKTVKIPMAGKLDSLNVSVAAALCMYQVYLQS
ncbi:rRNA methyltransferase [Clostridia bacterium]|nr:rRNA methyltransferase [Clostridia bacterium]